MAAAANATALSNFGLGPTQTATNPTPSPNLGDTKAPNTGEAKNPVNDTFLIFQSPEEIGELLANYVPGVGAFASSLSQQTQPQSQPQQHEQSQTKQQAELTEQGKVEQKHPGKEIEADEKARVEAQVQIQAQAVQLQAQFQLAQIEAQRQAGLNDCLPRPSVRPEQTQAHLHQAQAEFSSHPGNAMTQQQQQINGDPALGSMGLMTSVANEILSNGQSATSAKVDEDIFSDIAYCV